jgi:hypothetical protein
VGSIHVFMTILSVATNWGQLHGSMGRKLDCHRKRTTMDYIYHTHTFHRIALLLQYYYISYYLKLETVPKIQHREMTTPVRLQIYARYGAFYR